MAYMKLYAVSILESLEEAYSSVSKYKYISDS
jgi:hypothetical protein